MTARPITFLSAASLTVWLTTLAAGCGDNGLSAAINSNAIDTVTLTAASDTVLSVPSAYSISSQQPRFSQDNPDFDFVYNVDAGGHPVFLTSKVLGVVSSSTIRSGFRKSVLDFDSIATAPINGYTTADTLFPDTLPNVAGRVWYVRSSIVCAAGSPMYGKLEVLSIDAVARTITLRVLVDTNCGYHSLQNNVTPTY